MRFFAVEFTELGFFVLFGDAARHLVDAFEPLTSLVPDAPNRLSVEQVMLEQDISRLRRLIETFLRKLIARKRPLVRARHLQLATTLVDERPTVATARELAEHTGLSAGQLRRIFVETLGVSPKRFLGQRRGLRAFNAVMDGGVATGADLAQQLGYYDQAHFVHAFRAFTGFPPSRLPRARFQLARSFT